MQIDHVHAHCTEKPGATEDFPFGADVLTFKVGGKIFCLTDLGDFPLRLTLKCDPDRALELRQMHQAILPGYHMNKRHWNTVILDDTLAPDLVAALIDHSYDLVWKGLRKIDRLAIAPLPQP